MIDKTLSFLEQAMGYTDKFLSVVGQNLFLLFGLCAIGSAMIMVFAKNAVHCVLAFLATMLCVAACYFALGAEFLGVAQLLVYAGGIVVLFLFVVMLVELSKIKEHKLFQRQTPLAVAAAIAGLLGFWWVFIRLIFPASAETALANLPPELAEGLDVAAQNAQAISRGMFTGYLLPFETMSVILLIALIGAIVLAKQERV